MDITTFCILCMVLIIVGNLEVGAPMSRDLGFLDLFKAFVLIRRSRNSAFSFRKYLFSFKLAQHVQSYHHLLSTMIMCIKESKKSCPFINSDSIYKYGQGFF